MALSNFFLACFLAHCKIKLEWYLKTKLHVRRKTIRCSYIACTLKNLKWATDNAPELACSYICTWYFRLFALIYRANLVVNKNSHFERNIKCPLEYLSLAVMLSTMKCFVVFNIHITPSHHPSIRLEIFCTRLTNSIFKFKHIC